MKNLSLLLLGLALVIGATSCGQAQTQADAKEAQIKTFFHCPNGKALIEKEVAKEPGVQKVVADVETKIVTITYDPEVTDQDKLVAAIENTGYRTELTPEEKKKKKACSHDEPGGGDH
jgi:copper chaperone CopZ